VVLCNSYRTARRRHPGRQAAAAAAAGGIEIAAENTSTAGAEAANAEKETRAWLEQVVMGLNLCPFARAALPGTTVLVTRATTMEELRLDVMRELAVLKNADVASPQTTLVVLPPRTVAALGAETFEGFMEGCYKMAEAETRAVTASLGEDTREALDLIGELIEIVPFHPRATFGAIDAEDEADSGGYICTYLDVPEASDDDDEIVDSDEDDWDRESAGEWTRIPSDHDIPCGSGGGGNDDLSLDDGSSNGLSLASDGQLSAVRPIEGGGMDAAALKKLIADHARFQGGADTRADWAETNSASGEDDPADFTGRSPHPVLHLLRQSDVDAADKVWFSTGPGDDIRAKNAALLRGMGVGKLRKMLRACIADGVGGGGDRKE